MLDALHRRGRPAEGLERESKRSDVRSGSLADCEGDWAAIVMWHSLEHLPEPRQALTEAAQRLRPGGALFLAVPNFSKPPGAHVWRPLVPPGSSAPSVAPDGPRVAGRIARGGSDTNRGQLPSRWTGGLWLAPRLGWTTAGTPQSVPSHPEAFCQREEQDPRPLGDPSCRSHP